MPQKKTARKTTSKTSTTKRTRKTSSRTRRSSKKPKVYIPAYKAIIFCCVIITICMGLLLVTTLREPDKKLSAAVLERYKEEIIDSKKSEKPENVSKPQNEKKAEPAKNNESSKKSDSSKKYDTPKPSETKSRKKQRNLTLQSPLLKSPQKKLLSSQPRNLQSRFRFQWLSQNIIFQKQRTTPSLFLFLMTADKT